MLPPCNPKSSSTSFISLSAHESAFSLIYTSAFTNHQHLITSPKTNIPAVTSMLAIRVFKFSNNSLARAEAGCRERFLQKRLDLDQQWLEEVASFFNLKSKHRQHWGKDSLKRVEGDCLARGVLKILGAESEGKHRILNMFADRKD